jgi:hypothetical protein
MLGCGSTPEPHPAYPGVTENQHGRVVHRGTKGSNPRSSSGESGASSVQPAGMSPIRHADHNRVPFQAAGEISGFVICGGVRLSNAAVHGVIWRPHGAPVVRVDVGD